MLAVTELGNSAGRVCNAKRLSCIENAIIDLSCKLLEYDRALKKLEEIEKDES